MSGGACQEIARTSLWGWTYSGVLILRAHARIRSLSAAVSFGLMPYGWNRLSGRRSIAVSASANHDWSKPGS